VIADISGTLGSRFTGNFLGNGYFWFSGGGDA
jgi:hypothetical protein